MIGLMVPASAQTSDETLCMSRDSDIKIMGCTAVIQSGQETTARLAVAYSNRGTAYADRGLYDQAIADLTKAIALTPNDPETYNGRAWAYHLKGEDAKGLPDAEKAIMMAPNNADSIETRAEIYEKLGQRERAIADYRATLKLASFGSQAVQYAQDAMRLAREPSLSSAAASIASVVGQTFGHYVYPKNTSMYLPR
jgi:tetratricopeptide (TPR) repeat protein